LREYASGHFMKWNLKHPENMLYKMWMFVTQLTL
jgi:hypothetical protein